MTFFREGILLQGSPLENDTAASPLLKFYFKMSPLIIGFGFSWVVLQ